MLVQSMDLLVSLSRPAGISVPQSAVFGSVSEKVLLMDQIRELRTAVGRIEARLALVNTEPAENALEQKFLSLEAQWKADTRLTSSLTEIANHPAYQRIIGMGRSALPFIFRSLERAPDHWFWALHAITGDDPVNPADRGRLPRMAAAWLRWADARGLR